jgi:hypothetical protein
MELARAQTVEVSREWAALRSAKTGEPWKVRQKDGKTIKGELTAVTDAGLTLTRGNKPIVIDRDHVAMAWRMVKKPAKGKHALIGTGVGAAVGAGIGAIKYSPQSDDSEIFVYMGMWLGAGIGALVGMGMGAGRRVPVLVYQAR